MDDDGPHKTRLAFVENTAELKKIDCVCRKLFAEVGSQVATCAEDGSQGLLHELERWKDKFVQLPPEKRLHIQNFYEKRSHEWYVTERTGDLTHYMFMMAVRVMETRAPQMRQWIEPGQRKLRLRNLTVCAKCMNDEDGGHRYVSEEGYLTQEWQSKRRYAYRGGETGDRRNPLVRVTRQAME